MKGAELLNQRETVLPPKAETKTKNENPLQGAGGNRVDTKAAEKAQLETRNQSVVDNHWQGTEKQRNAVATVSIMSMPNQDLATTERAAILKTALDSKVAKEVAKLADAKPADEAKLLRAVEKSLTSRSSPLHPMLKEISQQDMQSLIRTAADVAKYASSPEKGPGFKENARIEMEKAVVAATTPDRAPSVEELEKALSAKQEEIMAALKKEPLPATSDSSPKLVIVADPPAAAPAAQPVPVPVPVPAPIAAQPVPVAVPVQAVPVPVPTPVQAVPVAVPVPVPTPVQAVPVAVPVPVAGAVPVAGQPIAVNLDSSIKGDDRRKLFIEQVYGRDVLDATYLARSYDSHLTSLNHNDALDRAARESGLNPTQRVQLESALMTLRTGRFDDSLKTQAEAVNSLTYVKTSSVRETIAKNIIAENNYDKETLWHARRAAADSVLEARYAKDSSPESKQIVEIAKILKTGLVPAAYNAQAQTAVADYNKPRSGAFDVGPVRFNFGRTGGEGRFGFELASRPSEMLRFGYKNTSSKQVENLGGELTTMQEREVGVEVIYGGRVANDAKKLFPLAQKLHAANAQGNTMEAAKIGREMDKLLAPMSNEYRSEVVQACNVLMGGVLFSKDKAELPGIKAEAARRREKLGGYVGAGPLGHGAFVDRTRGSVGVEFGATAKPSEMDLRVVKPQNN